jgi:hypothetical protein
MDFESKSQVFSYIVIWVLSGVVGWGYWIWDVRYILGDSSTQKFVDFQKRIRGRMNGVLGSDRLIPF